SAVSVKSVYQFGILKKVTKIINGSRNESENVLWDAETGEVLLTKTNNEFDQPIYTFNYPAHWMYPGMQGAYFNQGIYLTGLKIDANGLITNYLSELSEGDELIDFNSGLKYWVINSTNNSETKQYKLMNEIGQIILSPSSFPSLKIQRSGKRNMSNAVTGTVVSLQNPIKNNRLEISNAIKILDAKSIEYSDKWWKPLPSMPFSIVDNSIEWFNVEQNDDGHGTFWGIANLKLKKPVQKNTQITISYKINNETRFKDLYFIEGQSEILNENVTGNIEPGSLTDAKIVTDLNSLWPR
ncbi:MAG: hypothetical protein ACK52I_21485, partial [Pseudomonadota bacterium]